VKLLDREARPHVSHAARVAAASTLVIIGLYAVLCVTFDVVDSGHLVGQLDVRLADRLNDVAHGRLSLRAPSGVADDHEVETAPVLLWQIDASGRPIALSDNAPALPRGAWSRASVPVDASIGNAPFRLRSARIDGRWLVAGVSLAEVHHVESVVVASELIGGPVLALLFFLGAFFIGWRASAPVEQARRRQLEFTADASHELRTPLSVIEAEVSLALRSHRSAGEYRDVIERVGAESARLRHIVDDLLWLARFDSEPSSPLAEPVELGAVARDCTDRFGTIATARAITLSVHEDDPGNSWISAPPPWIDRLAGVLVDNACRYAGKGGRVAIAVQVRANRVVLAVRDSGPGIAPGERPYLFDRFRRATSEGSGAGLGLAIADAVVRSTGGHWQVGDADLGGASMEVSWSRLHVTDPALRSRRTGARASQTGRPAPEEAPVAPPR
jgi:signal transduction histidine kinase